MNRLKERYQKELVPALMKTLNLDECDAGAAAAKGSGEHWHG